MVAKVFVAFSFICMIQLPNISCRYLRLRPPSTCHHSTLSQSSPWSQVLNSGHITPSPSSPSTMRRLVGQLGELSGLINFHKDNYVDQVFGKTWENMEEENQDIGIEDILPRGSTVDRLGEAVGLAVQEYQSTSSTAHLEEAYHLFQRLALSLEMVEKDLRFYDEYSAKFGNMWRRGGGVVLRILQYIYTELLRQGVHPEPPLNRDVIGPRVRCVPHGVYRDVRDWLVMRSTEKVVDFFTQVLENI